MLPLALFDPLRRHLDSVRMLHVWDLREGYGEFHLTYALARKYPRGEKEWCWQYVSRCTPSTPYKYSRVTAISRITASGV